MVARAIMDIFPDRPFFVNVIGFSDQDVRLHKQEKFAVISKAPREIIRIKGECWSYPINSVYCKATPDQN